jgi:hypothetical protein
MGFSSLFSPARLPKTLLLLSRGFLGLIGIGTSEVCDERQGVVHLRQHRVGVRCPKWPDTANQATRVQYYLNVTKTATQAHNINPVISQPKYLNRAGSPGSHHLPARYLDHNDRHQRSARQRKPSTIKVSSLQSFLPSRCLSHGSGRTQPCHLGILQMLGTVTVTDRPCASVLVTAFCPKAILAMESVNAATLSITPANFVIVTSLTKGSAGTVLLYSKRVKSLAVPLFTQLRYCFSRN